MNILKRNKKVFTALLLVFMAPGILALLFYMNPGWLSGLPTNKGLMLHPPVSATFLDSASKEKWHMVVWCPQGCDESCLQSLDEMARTRLALGRQLYRVDLWLLQGKSGLVCNKKMAEALKTEAVRTYTLSEADQKNVPLLQELPKVFLADPKQYFVLEYGALGKARDVFQDLKRLLSSGEQA